MRVVEVAKDKVDENKAIMIRPGKVLLRKLLKKKPKKVSWNVFVCAILEQVIDRDDIVIEVPSK